VSAQLPEHLRTQRLILRKPRESDGSTLFQRYTQDINVARYTVWQPHSSLAQTEAFIEECIQEWHAGVAQAYIMAFSDDADSAIGMIEARPKSHIVDIGYVLGASHWGKGLMTEAIRALTATVLVDPRFFRVQATCDVENRASARALEKSDFVREGRLERHTVHPNISPEPRPCFLYARCR
jgi:[ribosomal protein S5]-alanine N-acetyltransferase